MIALKNLSSVWQEVKWLTILSRWIISAIALFSKLSSGCFVLKLSEEVQSKRKIIFLFIVAAKNINEFKFSSLFI